MLLCCSDALMLLLLGFKGGEEFPRVCGAGDLLVVKQLLCSSDAGREGQWRMVDLRIFRCTGFEPFQDTGGHVCHGGPITAAGWLYPPQRYTSGAGTVLQVLTSSLTVEQQAHNLTVASLFSTCSSCISTSRQEKGEHSAHCFLSVSDVLKLQFAESAVPEALSEMIHDLQGGSDPHDLCSIKIASNLIVSLLLGGGWQVCHRPEDHPRL